MSKRRKLPTYTANHYLCSAGEFAFFQALEDAVGEQFSISMKVRAAALLGCRRCDWRRLGRRVSQKEIDFVLTWKGTSRVACAIELDDKTHDLPSRRRRDGFLDAAFKSAGLPLVRVRAARRYARCELAGRVLRATSHRAVNWASQRFS